MSMGSLWYAYRKDHARKRAFDRYGVVYSDDDMSRIRRKCRAATLYATTPDGKVYRVRYQGTVTYPILRDGVPYIVTFLTRRQAGVYKSSKQPRRHKHKSVEFDTRNRRRRLKHS